MSKEITYSSWPLGKVPKEWHRPELEDLKKLGYEWEDPRDVIDIFERKVANFAGSKYAVSLDSCSNGLFLSLKYLNASGRITIPKRTYVSVPMQIMHAGCEVCFEDLEWTGLYQLKPYPVYDSATRFTKGMYLGGNVLQVVSFQIKKRLPIGRGAMILTDDKEAYEWLCRARHDGRDLNVNYMDDDFNMLGWHMYMIPEDAARGIIIMDQLPKVNDDSGGSNNYSDLSTKGIFK
jgi:dTDP-4-amino-4,6-dideoxygalactose transaminase